MKLKALIASATTALMTACGSVDVDHYAKETPKLELSSFFTGTIDAWGIFQKRNGEVARRFHVEILTEWKSPDEGILDEHFDWSDGEKQRRVWKLKAVGPHRYIGRADDVDGEAIGEIYGNALRWRYTLNVPFRGSTIGLNFDDWMILIDDKVMLNRAVFSKWGIRMGEVTLSFSK